jgi:hypothetical protein
VLTAKGERAFDSYEEINGTAFTHDTYDRTSKILLIQFWLFIQIFASEFYMGAEAIIVNNEIKVFPKKEK